LRPPQQILERDEHRLLDIEVSGAPEDLDRDHLDDGAVREMENDGGSVVSFDLRDPWHCVTLPDRAGVRFRQVQRTKAGESAQRRTR